MEDYYAWIIKMIQQNSKDRGTLSFETIRKTFQEVVRFGLYVQVFFWEKMEQDTT